MRRFHASFAPLDLSTFARAALIVLAGLAATGCTPEIGDKCILSTDCSLRGERLCDTSQPAGYCTILNCRGNLCPDDAACVLFHPTVQGCGYNDRSPSRTGRTFCVKTCEDNSDCRAGYVCDDPRRAPWDAIILDDNQSERVCIVPESSATGGQGVNQEAPVCQAAAPDAGQIDAAPREDASASDAGDAGDAGVDASDAAAPDAGDAGIVDAGSGG
jgi:hypothetical protein